MSVASELARLQGIRNAIRNTLVGWGAANTTDTFDEIATKLGTIQNNGTVNASVKEGETFTIPKGYHNGSGTVTGVQGGGSYELQTKEVTPMKTEQNITPDAGYYGLSGVTVGAIPGSYQDVSAVTAEEGDVLAGKIIVGADGTTKVGSLANNGELNLTFDGLTETSVTLPAGFTTGGTVSLTDEIERALAAI